MNKKIKLNRYIDHTLLKPDVKRIDIEKLCREAIEYDFFGVCVNSTFIPLISKLLEGKNPIPIAVVGFPLGANLSSSKAFEAKEAIVNGAKEIDMVMNIGALKDKDYEKVYEDICLVVNEVKPYPLKVIIETAFLERDEKILSCILSQVAKASYIKTSTGFWDKGAVIDDIILIKGVIGDNMKIKASGGIKRYDEAISLIEAGADRIGSSSSVNIMKKNF
ncbi:MAG: hypothetical protein AMS24_03390 [Chlamydiae bacterium SM23_39]|nr:MAG: hypothetical protein AMS24_03390 [Chlamydiae bacterium SM23_39]